MSSETWRVVLASGETREVVAERAVEYGYAWPEGVVLGWRVSRVGDGPRFAAAEAMGDSAHEAAARLAAGNGSPVAEILAPGEPSRAELTAQRDRAALGLDAAMAGAQRYAAEAAELRSERAELVAQRDALAADATILARFTRSVSFSPCTWDYDEETGEYACDEPATHRVEGPHDVDCGSYCKTHAERTRNERCGQYTHRYHVISFAGFEGLSEARAAASRVLPVPTPEVKP